MLILRALRNIRIRRLKRVEEIPSIMNALRAELKRPGDVVCCVCMEVVPNMMFRRCQHVCLCSVCYSLSGQKQECPICRQVSGAVEVFFP